MKENEKYIEFVDKIFERSTDPVEQLERMFDNHPLIFFIKEVCEHINEKLKVLGYKLNMNYIKEIENIDFSCGSKPSGCGSSSSGGCGSRKRRGSCAFGLGDLRRKGIDRVASKLITAI